MLKNIIRATKLVRAYGLASECELYLKPENQQITGSFKVRGSAYKIAMLTDEEKEKGVIACSAGNHAQCGCPCRNQKLHQISDLSARYRPHLRGGGDQGPRRRVCLVEGCYEDAYNKALELCDEKGNTESVNGCFLRIDMETRNYDHVNLITQSLLDAGFKIV